MSSRCGRSRRLPANTLMPGVSSPSKAMRAEIVVAAFARLSSVGNETAKSWLNELRNEETHSIVQPMRLR